LSLLMRLIPDILAEFSVSESFVFRPELSRVFPHSLFVHPPLPFFSLKGLPFPDRSHGFQAFFSPFAFGCCRVENSLIRLPCRHPAICVRANLPYFPLFNFCCLLLHMTQLIITPLSDSLCFGPPFPGYTDFDPSIPPPASTSLFLLPPCGQVTPFYPLFGSLHLRS